jgi:1-acyl-sn-glycerol-3-phosphate acyltransferase
VKDDRPGGDAPGAPHDAGSAAPARFQVFPGGGRERAARLPVGVARRLSRLERRVEEALAASGDAARDDRDAVAAAADGLLAAFAELRRRSLTELVTAVGSVEAGEALVALLYRWWWRVDTVALDRVPARGRVILAVNRSGALLPYEALMLRAALARDGAVSRTSRLLVDDWLLRVPGIGPALAGLGAIVTTQAARRALARDEALVCYPEGPAAAAKPFRDRYRLAAFGRGVARLAIATGTPIVPVAVIGAEETHPVLARLDPVGRLLGLPTLPVTATFPWLGVAGLVPLPTKWTLLCGEPLEVADRHPPEAARDATAVARVRDQVRERLQALVLEGLRRRVAIFRG